MEIDETVINIFMDFIKILIFDIFIDFIICSIRVYNKNPNINKSIFYCDSCQKER